MGTFQMRFLLCKSTAMLLLTIHILTINETFQIAKRLIKLAKQEWLRRHALLLIFEFDRQNCHLTMQKLHEELQNIQSSRMKGTLLLSAQKHTSM